MAKKSWTATVEIDFELEHDSRDDAADMILDAEEVADDYANQIEQEINGIANAAVVKIRENRPVRIRRKR